MKEKQVPGNVVFDEASVRRTVLGATSDRKVAESREKTYSVVLNLLSGGLTATVLFGGLDCIIYEMTGQRQYEGWIRIIVGGTLVVISVVVFFRREWQKKVRAIYRDARGEIEL